MTNKNLPQTNEALRNAIVDMGDTIVDYINSNGKKRYAVVTADILSPTSPYVVGKTLEYSEKYPTAELVNATGVLVFAWDADKFMRISASAVTALTPMSSQLCSRN